LLVFIRNSGEPWTLFVGDDTLSLGVDEVGESFCNSLINCSLCSETDGPARRVDRVLPELLSTEEIDAGFEEDGVSAAFFGPAADVTGVGAETQAPIPLFLDRELPIFADHRTSALAGQLVLLKRKRSSERNQEQQHEFSFSFLFHRNCKIFFFLQNCYLPAGNRTRKKLLILDEFIRPRGLLVFVCGLCVCCCAFVVVVFGVGDRSIEMRMSLSGSEARYVWSVSPLLQLGDRFL
jgi:hypothetical protein